jgi:hypothetical protein
MNPINQVLDLSFMEVKTISLLLLGFINYPCDFCAKTDYILALCICYPQRHYCVPCFISGWFIRERIRWKLEVLCKL